MSHKKPARLRTGVAAGVILSAIFVVLCQLPSGLVELTVTPFEGGPPLWAGRFKPGDRFTIHYYHSVENAPIWEVHSMDSGGRIYIEEERYLKFGAGMGKMPGVGHMVRRGPYEVIEDMHMPTGDFVLRIGSPGVDHTIIWRDTKTNLSAIAPHTAVRFKAKPLSVVGRLWRLIRPNPAEPRTFENVSKTNLILKYQG